MKLISILVITLSAWSLAAASQVSIKTEEIVQMSFSFPLSLEHCVSGNADYGSAYTACNFEFEVMPEGGEIDFLELDDDGYVETEVIWHNDFIQVYFIQKAWIDDPDQLDPQSLFEGLKDYYKDKEAQVVLRYKGPKIDIKEFGQPIPVNP